MLANDVAPTGGSLDAGTVEVRAAHGGSFEVDAASGVVTVTPDPGFWGTVETSYVVYDNWGIGVEADLTVSDQDEGGVVGPALSGSGQSVVGSGQSVVDSGPQLLAGGAPPAWSSIQSARSDGRGGPILAATGSSPAVKAAMSIAKSVVT